MRDLEQEKIDAYCKKRDEMPYEWERCTMLPVADARERERAAEEAAARRCFLDLPK